MMILHNWFQMALIREYRKLSMPFESSATMPYIQVTLT